MTIDDEWNHNEYPAPLILRLSILTNEYNIPASDFEDARLNIWFI